MAFDYFIVEDLFEKIKGSDKSLKIEYGVGDYYLIQSDFEIEQHFLEYYLIVKGYEYFLTEKKPLHSIIDLREVRNIHIIQINEELNKMREDITNMFGKKNHL